MSVLSDFWKKLTGKTEYVNAVTQARSTVTAAVTAFSTLSADLSDAAEILSNEARSARDYAAQLVADAVALETEADQSAKLSTKLADFLA